MNTYLCRSCSLSLRSTPHLGFLILLKLPFRGSRPELVAVVLLCSGVSHRLVVETLGTAANWGLALHSGSTVSNTVDNNRSTPIAVIVGLSHRLVSPSPRLEPEAEPEPEPEPEPVPVPEPEVRFGPGLELGLGLGHSKLTIAAGSTAPLAGCSNLGHLQLVAGRSIAGSRRHNQRQYTGR